MLTVTKNLGCCYGTLTVAGLSTRPGPKHWSPHCPSLVSSSHRKGTEAERCDVTQLIGWLSQTLNPICLTPGSSL